jgi:hypothetical protein
MRKRVIDIFAAYKFDSNYYRKEDLEIAIREAVRNSQAGLKRKFKDLTLHLTEQKEISSGEYVGEFVKENLDKAIIKIFELSDREPNVTFELGYSLGTAKHRFTVGKGYDVFIKSDSVSHRDVISDLLGKFIVSYEYDPSTRQKEEYKKIRRKIELELKRKISNLLEDDKFLKSLIWHMYEEKVYVICSYIPPADQAKYGVRSSLSEYGDFNTVYDVCTFLKGILHCNIEYFHCRQAKSIKDLFDNNVIIVGGPMWNEYSTEFMNDYNLPYQYKWSPEKGVEDYILNKINNKPYYTSKIRKQGIEIITKDYGIFAVLPNKFNDDKSVILISGISSRGGLGAARAFTEGGLSRENCKVLAKDVGFENYFVTLIESDIRWGEFPYSKKIDKSKTFAYIKDKNSWTAII